jgi:hypothetical protein
MGGSADPAAPGKFAIAGLGPVGALEGSGAGVYAAAAPAAGPAARGGDFGRVGPPQPPNSLLSSSAQPPYLCGKQWTSEILLDEQFIPPYCLL